MQYILYQTSVESIILLKVLYEISVINDQRKEMNLSKKTNRQ